MATGVPFGLKPGHTSTIRRIEGARPIADMDIQTNPFELGLDRLVSLDAPHDFIGKAALQQIKLQGISRKQIGLNIDGERLSGPNTRFWPLQAAGTEVGKVTSAVFSPRLNQNIAMAMVTVGVAEIGTVLTVKTSTDIRTATVVEKPFIDPHKKITKS